MLISLNIFQLWIQLANTLTQMLIHKHSCRWSPSQRNAIFRVSSNYFFFDFMNLFFFVSPKLFCVCLITSFSVQGTWVSRTALSPQGCGTWQSWSECHKVSSKKTETQRDTKKRVGTATKWLKYPQYELWIYKYIFPWSGLKTATKLHHFDNILLYYIFLFSRNPVQSSVCLVSVYWDRM